jgi:hypothetical protein
MFYLNALLTKRSGFNMVVNCFLGLGIICSLQSGFNPRIGRVPILII